MSDNEFEQGDAGAANITLEEAGRRKAGSLLMMKEEVPCKVTNLSTAKPGKHGSAKAMVVAKDIFTDKQYEETFGTGDMIPCPVVTKTEYVCIDCDDDGVLMLMDAEGGMKEDLSLPTESHLSHLEKDVKKMLEAGKYQVLAVVQLWGTRQQLVAVREGEEQ